MNSKIAVVAAVIAMVLSGLVLVSADSQATDPTTVDKGVVVIAGAGGEGIETASFAFTEAELANYDYVLTFKVGDKTLGTVDYDASSPGVHTFTAVESSDTISSIYVSMDTTNNDESHQVGEYTVTFTSTGAGIATFTIVCSAEVTTDAGTVTSAINYRYTVIAYDSSGSGTGPFTLDAMSDLVEGQICNKQVEITQDSVDESAFYWYAVSLPAGLSMDPNGNVSGVPLEVVNGKSYRVVATDRVSGEQFELTLRITVTDKDGTVADSGNNNFTYSVSAGTNTSNNDPTSFAVESGTEVTITVKKSAGVDGVSVVIIDEDGTSVETLTTSNGGIATFTPSGTGAYRVVITNDTAVPDAAEVTKSFYLYVTPFLDDVTADITISSSN